MNDIERIAFVSRRFNELKGLQPAATGAILLAGSVLLRFLFASSSYAIEPAFFLNAAMVSVNLGWLVFEPRYRATFGRTQSTLGEAAVVLPMILMMVGLMIDVVAHKAVHPSAHWPSAAAIALALSSFVVLVRDWRWRVHHVIPLAAAVVAAIVTFAVPVERPAFSWEGDSLRGSVFLLAYALIGAGMIAAGLLDHALLLRTLRPTSVDTSEHLSPKRSQAGRSESRLAGVVGGCALLTLFFPPGEMVLVLPLALTMVGFALSMIFFRRARRLQKASPQAIPAEALDETREIVVPLIVLAVAGIIDVALSSAGPVVSTVAIGAWSLSIAVRGWPTHRHYLLGAVTAAGLLLLMPQLVPAQAVTVCVLATAAALAIERYLDSGIENTHADAI